MLISNCEKSRVLTVFTGAPDEHRRSGWNFETTSQSYAPDTHAVRRDEDHVAVTGLGAEPRWMGWLEAEYRTGPADVDALADAVARHVSSSFAPVLVAPLGLRHPDHVATSDACLALARRGDVDLWLWRDLPYAVSFPEDEGRRRATLDATGIRLVDAVNLAVDTTEKDAAIDAYASQVARLRIDFPSFDESRAEPERVWRVEIGA